MKNPRWKYTNQELKNTAVEKICSIQADYVLYAIVSKSRQQENRVSGIFAIDQENNLVLGIQTSRYTVLVLYQSVSPSITHFNGC